jgi:hypothetical protein
MINQPQISNFMSSLWIQLAPVQRMKAAMVIFTTHIMHNALTTKKAANKLMFDLLLQIQQNIKIHQYIKVHQRLHTAT